MTQENEREYPVQLGICLTLLRQINQARRQGQHERADQLLKKLHQVEGRNG